MACPRVALLLLVCSTVMLLASGVGVVTVLYRVVVPHLQQQAHIGVLCTVVGVTTRAQYCPSCPRCVVITVQYKDLQDRLRTGHLQRIMDDRRESKCFCAGCLQQQNLTRELDIGQTFSCYFKTTPREAVPRKLSSVTWHAGTGSSTGLTLHAILWPTVFFVLGFVGLFFGFVQVSHNHEPQVEKFQFSVSVAGKQVHVL